MRDLLANPQPSGYEFAFAIGIAVSFLILFTVIDIVIHDGFVRPIIAGCPPEVITDFCEERRLELLVNNPLTNFLKNTFLSEQDEQLRLGGQYWMMLLIIVIFFVVFVMIFRLFSGILAGASINPMLFIITGMYGYSVLSLYYFGWLDWLYYVSRKLPVPDDLPWLNGVGLFQYVQNHGINSNVNNSDLFILMIFGLISLIGGWAILIHHHKKGKLEEWGLI
ncbi:MAG: hypothetical protein K5790_10405 [Nitrosopumilus sp.]|uniref:hypothetical protein n=1 Tax=Nitrosopumilus sp. TaxID=2024843 RepID=UPI00247DEF77|nr:hypothetical protein [Nitrosopumilus sp.]MCV0393681.1 hypothetical protein [Nitrosopumilus sp.]